ncbi:hypothetical protein Droror1_Dr00020799 [Drosera rotundifolia]
MSNQPVRMDDTPPDQQHVARIGISRGTDAVGTLGETEHSHGFGGTGKFSNAGRFSNYGETFGVGDSIVCAVDLEGNPPSIGFSKNGKWLGFAKHFSTAPHAASKSSGADRLWESAMFPHVLLKNVVVQMQFSVEKGLVVEEGYKPWASAIDDGNAIMGPSVSDAAKCEVMMLVGLPASGKSTWADKWVKEHPEQRYVLLGTNLVLDQMKVPGLLRRGNYGERFDRLMDRATGIFNTLLSRASMTPRNYIIDQTNVYKNARKRKLKPFSAYHKIAVVVFPKPEELKLRAEKRFKEMGKEVPAEAVSQMLANYILPTSKDMPHTDEEIDQVIFTELNRVDAQKYLDEMKRDLLAASEPRKESNKLACSGGSSVQADFGHSPWKRGYPHSEISHSRGHVSGVVPSPRPSLGYGCQPSTYVPAPQAGPDQSARLQPYARVHQVSRNPVEAGNVYHKPYLSYRSSLPIEDPRNYDMYRHDLYRRYDTERSTNHYVAGSESQFGISGAHIQCDSGGGAIAHTPGAASYSIMAEISAAYQSPLETQRNLYSYDSENRHPTHPADLRLASKPFSGAVHQNQFHGSYEATHMGGSYHSLPPSFLPPPYY